MNEMAIGNTDIIYVDTDTQYKLLGVYNDATDQYINDATVELTLLDSNGDEVTGQSWPLTLAYVAGSDGDYSGQITDAIAVSSGTTGTVVIDIDGDGLQTQLRLPVSFEDRDQASLAWSSRTDLDNLFGRSNITQWADLENEEDETQIRQRVRWAITEATAEARERLATLISLGDLASPSKPLRLTVTRIAGVLLYESRGVKDTSDDEGKHRLSTHKAAVDKFFREVAAGRRVLTSTNNSVPFVVPNDDSLTTSLDGTVRYRINET